jgi:hypothetical protein
MEPSRILSMQHVLICLLYLLLIPLLLIGFMEHCIRQHTILLLRILDQQTKLSNAHWIDPIPMGPNVLIVMGIKYLTWKQNYVNIVEKDEYLMKSKGDA